MSVENEKLPAGNFDAEGAVVRTAGELGAIARARRKRQALKQIDLAGIAGTGNRFIVELERGKPTVQLQKTLDILALLGLEVVVRPKTGRGLR